MPSVLAAPGWVANARWSAVAGLIVTGAEVTLVRPLPVKTMVIFVATRCDKFVKVTTPLTAVRSVVPA